MITISAFADEIAPDLKTQMDVCKANGVKCIDVRGIDGKNVSKMTPSEASEYKKLMDDRGFAVPCIGSPIGKITMDDDLDEHLELLKNCCHVAKAFGTDLIRVFSFYASEGKNIADQREAVMDRMAKMVELAETSNCILLHENERDIYGASPEGVKDLFATITSGSFKSIFDPANFVSDGLAPYDDAWKTGLDKLTYYFHIKDKIPGEKTCVQAGQGAGQCQEIFTDLKARNWSGYMTLEPHMAAAGQFSGFTGPDLFGQAAQGLQTLCDTVGLSYQ
jgi:sugar phosphate isomerase/epimerase